MLAKERYLLGVMVATLLSACSSFLHLTSATFHSPDASQPSGAINAALTPALPPPFPLSLSGDENGRVFENGRVVAVRVNGQPIYLGMFEKQMARFEQVLQAQGIDRHSRQGQTALAAIRSQVVEALIDQLIIEQAARKAGVIAPPAAVTAKVQENIAGAGDKAQLEAWLSTNQMSYDEFQHLLSEELIAGQMFEYINRDVARITEQVRLRQIQVADLATAQAVIEQLKQGADFAILAQEKSLDEKSRANGGDMGWFPRGLDLLPPEVEAVAFSLQPGQMSGPIQSRIGFHVIKLEDRAVDRPLTNDLYQAIKKRRFAEWLNQQRSVAVVEKYIAF